MSEGKRPESKDSAADDAKLSDAGNDLSGAEGSSDEEEGTNSGDSGDGVNDDDEYASSEDEEDDAVFEELVGLKRPLAGGESAASSAQKKSKNSDDEEEEEDNVRFVPDNMDEIDADNIIPRGRRTAAIRSGLLVQENKFAHLVDDSDDGEAEF